MRSRLFLVQATTLSIALLASACGDDDQQSSGGSGPGGSTGTGSPTEPPELEGITAAHNQARADVDPPASTPIPPLSWDAELAAVAQAYADRCIFEHSGNAYGENLAANTGSTSAPEVVGRWVAEVADYDYASNSCATGQVCGHYTQVVWADSARLGCGVTDCTTGSPFSISSSWQNWVCNYDPPGNWVGEHPY